MALPAYIPVRTVGFRGVLELEQGKGLTAKVAVRSSGSLRWADTGELFETLGGTFTSGRGASVTFPLPVTDDDGWLTTANEIIDVSEGGAYTHTYTATVVVMDASGRQVGDVYEYGPFVVPASESTLWLDELEEQTTTAGSVVARPTVYAVNGQDGDVTITAAGLGAYVKPGTGVPKTDLASAVQTSLGKADTALQPDDVGTMAAENAADYLTADQTNAAIVAEMDRSLALREAALGANLDGGDRQFVPFVTDALAPPPTGAAVFETSLGTVDVTSNLVATVAAHGLSLGDRVRFADRVGLPFANGNAYYVSEVGSNTTFRVYAGNATSGGNLNFGGNGTATVYKSVPFTLGTWSRSWGAVTGDADGDSAGSDVLITTAPHGLRVGDPVAFLSSTIGGVSNDTQYWVRERVSATKFRISATRDRVAVVELSSDGTATLCRPEPRISTFGFPLKARAFNTSAAGQVATPDTGIITVGPGGVSTAGIAFSEVRVSGATIPLRFFRSGSNREEVWVNGLYYRTVTDADLAAAGVTSSTIGILTLTMPNAGPWDIKVVGDDFAGVITPALESLSLPVTPIGARLVIPGDSFTASSGAATESGGWAYVAARAAGIRDIVPMGVGGTGYAKSSSLGIAWVDHWEDALIPHPDMIIPALGLNDHEVTLSTVLAAAETCITGWAAATRVPFVIGPWPAGGGAGSQPATLTALDEGLRELVEGMGIVYYSPIDTGPMFNTGDGTHPNSEGHKALGIWAGARLAPA